MVEFRGILLKETSAKQKTLGPVQGMDVNINLDKLKITGNTILVDFTYKVVYLPNVGNLLFKGTVAFSDEPKNILEYKKQWKKTKLFQQDVMEPLMNLINITSMTNGVLVTRAVNLAPPMVPPKLEVNLGKRRKNPRKK